MITVHYDRFGVMCAGKIEFDTIAGALTLNALSDPVISRTRLQG